MHLPQLHPQDLEILYTGQAGACKSGALPAAAPEQLLIQEDCPVARAPHPQAVVAHKLEEVVLEAGDLRPGVHGAPGVHLQEGGRKWDIATGYIELAQLCWFQIGLRIEKEDVLAL